MYLTKQMHVPTINLQYNKVSYSIQSKIYIFFVLLTQKITRGLNISSKNVEGPNLL